MIWLTWRQFRVQAYAAAAALATVAIALILTGPRLARLYRTSGLGSCVVDDNCPVAQRAFAGAVQDDNIYPLVFFVSIAILYLTPALIGMFWGAPLVARELEAGTFRLTWSQSVTRTRWLTVKLVLVSLAAMLTAGLLSWAVTWWSGPIDAAGALPDQDQGLGLPNRFMPLLFGARGIAPVGYAAFAVALGVATGMLVRRMLPAMAVTLVVLATAQLIVPTVIRSQYREPAYTTTALTLAPGTPHEIRIDGDTMAVSIPVSVPGGWITSVQTIDAAGRPFTGPAPHACLDRTSTPEQCDSAINDLQLRQRVAHQPAGRYWTFQSYEALIYLVLAAVLAVLCVWRVRRLRLS